MTVVLVVNILGLFIAILLSQAGKLTNIFRSVFFLPYVLSTVAISFIWLAILSYTDIKFLAEIVGLGDLVNDYIGTRPMPLKSICIIEIWRDTGLSHGPVSGIDPDGPQRSL